MFDQDRVNSKHGGGGLQSSEQANLDRQLDVITQCLCAGSAREVHAGGA